MPKLPLPFLLLLGCLTRIALCQPLHAPILVIDPGHGDRAWGEVPADPGAGADTPAGRAWECVFSWDTAMRLKELAEERGATVLLTLEDPSGNYSPHDWNTERIPQPGTPEFPYRRLVDIPRPQTVHQALYSRVLTANRIYRRYRWTHHVYFISLHFDSTNPEVAGISFYYPPWLEESEEVRVLSNSIRNKERARKSLLTGAERGLAQRRHFAVLSLAENANSFLVELGNIRSLNIDGSNPDLWRMRDPESRQAYAQLLVEALEKMPKRPLPQGRNWKPATAVILLFLLLLARLRGTKRSRLESAEHGRDSQMP